jgi:hypothetical protein
MATTNCQTYLSVLRMKSMSFRLGRGREVICASTRSKISWYMGMGKEVMEVRFALLNTCPTIVFSCLNVSY